MGPSSRRPFALYPSALDNRGMATTVSAYLNTYKDIVLTVRTPRIVNYLTGILKYAEVYGVAAPIAPRPFLAKTAYYDPDIPIGVFRTAVEKVKQAYARRFG